MAVRVDPEGNEIRALFDLVNRTGRDVLEVVCGDGRLTWRYADNVSHVRAGFASDREGRYSTVAPCRLPGPPF